LLRPLQAQLPLGFEPIVKVLSVAAAAAQVTLIRCLGDLVVRRAVGCVVIRGR